MTNQKLNLLIVGGGMYVRGINSNHGTILPAVLEGVRSGLVANEVAIAVTSQASANHIREYFNTLKQEMGIEATLWTFPENEFNPEAYKIAYFKYKPDAVIISTPDHTHYSICKFFLENDVHVLVVKPLTPCYAQAIELTEIASKNNLIAEVEFHKRLDESNIIAKNRIEDYMIGELLYSVVTYSQRKIIPQEVFKSWSNKSNIFQYLGIHYVDLLYWLTKHIPISIHAKGQKKYLATNGIDTCDSMQVMIEWQLDQSRFVSMHATNWIDPNVSSAMSDQKISIIGSAGRIDLDQKNRGIELCTDQNGIEAINPYFSCPTYQRGVLQFNGYGIKNIIQYLKDVNEYMNGETTLEQIEESRPTFKSSLISTKVIEMVNLSLKENCEEVLF